MSDPVTTILPGLMLMPVASALALSVSRVSNRRDAQFYTDLGAILSQHDEAAGFIGNAQISGTVAISGVPASRLVVLFDHYTMRPLASTWSDPVTGAYLFTGLALNRKYLVVCDDYTRTYNAAVADWVEAE